MKNMIDIKLLREQGLSDEEIRDVKKLQSIKKELEEKMDKTTNSKELKELYGIWYKNEVSFYGKLFKGGTRVNSENLVRFWELPHCTCPFMDNHDRYPYGHYVVNCSCPVHGS